MIRHPTLRFIWTLFCYGALWASFSGHHAWAFVLLWYAFLTLHLAANRGFL